jgi:hypothetical protein
MLYKRMKSRSQDILTFFKKQPQIIKQIQENLDCLCQIEPKLELSQTNC